MDRDLFLAILAMDSYNRKQQGAPVGIVMPTEGALGNAILYLRDEDLASNFFVQSYYWDNEIIVSYRGTDDDRVSDLSSDVWTGWITGGGAYMGPQAQRAAEFFNVITGDGQYTSNVVLTGHSLGGGLAGLLAAVHGIDAVVFDNMPFELAASKAYDFSKTAVWDESGIPTVIDPAARALYYYGQEPISSPDTSGIDAYAVVGEILALIRPAQSTPVTPLNPWLDPNQDELGSTDLHSQALLVTLLYEQGIEDHFWRETIAQTLIKQLFNDEVALAAGIKPASAQDGTASPAAKMLRMIGYSAIDEGERPFGDSGIRALFDDANQLGKPMLTWGNYGPLKDLSEALTQIITQYAATLAWRDDESASRKEGVVTLGPGDATLAVDLSASTWEVNGHTTDRIVGRETLLRNLDVGGALTGVTWNAFGMLYGATSLDRIERLAFKLSIDGQPVAIPEPSPTSGPVPLTFFAGTSSGDVIQGATADEIIYGGQGNDTINGGLGKDLLIGDFGDDHLVGGEDDDVLIGGEGKDTAEYTPSNATTDGVVGAVTVASADPRGLQIVSGPYDTDTFFEVETIKLTDRPDALSVNDSALNIRTTIDMGLSGPANVITNVDTIDYSNVTQGLNYFYGHVSARTGTANSYGTQFSGIGEEMATIIDSRLRTGLHNKGLVVEGADKVILTGHDDALIGAARGSIVETGAGNDKIWVMPGVAISDLSSTDRLTLFGTMPLYGGLKSKYSESAYASWYGGLVKYGLNQQGDLIIRTSYMDDDDPGMFILNWKANAVADGGGELGPGSIFLAEYDIGVFNLLDPDLPSGSVTSQLQFLCAVLKVLIGAQAVNDPLVLDLDGDGIELTMQTSVSPLFDMDGDLFAERTGWVKGDDGLLALDANANGKVDSVRELFGGPGASGFAELATYDSNSDGIINNLDAVFSDLRVWRDLDGDGVTDAGELKTLAELSIASINLANTPQSGVTNAGNDVLATGTFTRSDGSTGTLADIGLNADQIHTEYLGDKSVSTAAAALPELKGRGTLTDLRVAMTLDPTLITTVQTALPALNTLDLAALRAAALPLLQGWAQAVKLPDASGTLVTVPPAAHADLPVLVELDDDGRPHVTDFAYEFTDAQSSYWRLASGDPIRDANGDPIQRPTYQNVLDQTGGWTLFTGAEIAFMERYTGVDLPIDTVTSVPAGGLDAMSSIVDNLFTALNRLAIRLAIQGPLADYFDGIAYDIAADTFHATTDRQLIPVYEAIFAAAPGTAGGAADYLAGWKPLLDYLLGDFDRGAAHLEVTYSYVFAAMAAAYESTGLATDITTTAGALGVPTDLIVTGTGTLTGSNDADIFYMGAGNQTARGGIGLDAYVFGKNFGQDVIDDQEPEAGSKDPDIIRFADIKSTEITATRVGLDLILTVTAPGDTVTVLEQFEGRLPSLFGGDFSRDTGVHEIIFADGVVWDKMDIAKAVSHPLATNDTLIGTPDVDVLDGGAGTDYLSGGNDTDLYRFSTGYGSDTIDENMENILIDGFDIVQFGEGLSLEDVEFRRVGSTDNVEVEIIATGDKLMVAGQFMATYTGPLGKVWLDKIESFAFEDGSYMTWDGLMAQLVADAKTAGNDTIYGFSWEDTLDGGAGNDFLAGRNENDTYIFGLGYGNDTIHEQEDNILSGEIDEVIFAAGIDPASVTLSRNGNSNDVQFGLSDGSTLTVQGQFNAVYTGVFDIVWFDRVEFFRFQDAANTVWTYETIMQRLIDQASTSGDDEIYGFSRNDTLDGGAGNDYLAGGNESDTYVFDVGYGQDVVDDAPTTILDANLDKITFGPGITTQNIRLARSGPYDLIISVDGQPDTLLVNNQFAADNLGNRMWEIESFHFVDGTIWSPWTIQTKLLQSTSGNDTLIGFFSADTLDGGAGDDRLEGGDDGDSYVFDVGYGQDVIFDQQSSIFFESPDKVLLGPGITTQNIRLSRSGNDLIVGIDGHTDTLRIVSSLAANNLGGRLEEVEELRFADGTVWTRSTIQAKLLQGTAGNDTLVGFFSADVLDGGAGNDRLDGGDVGDVYKFDIGYGQDVIHDSQTSIFAVTNDRVEFGPGINADQLRFTRNGSNLTISLVGASDTLTIEGQFNAGVGSNFNLIEEFRFADGTVMGWVAVQNELLQGTPGDDLIVGFETADILDGGAGNDRLEGADHGDTYKFDVGYGNDTIVDLEANTFLTAPDRVLFGAGITTQNIRLARTGNDLIISVDGYSDTLRILGEFVADNLGHRFMDVEEFHFADGTVWDTWTIQTKLLQGTSGNDTLIGFFSNDTLDGGAGNDRLEGQDGGDTYVFGLGYGRDVILDQQTSIFADSPDKVQLGAGILPDDVSVTRIGGTNDLVLSIPGTSDRLTILGYFYNYNRIEEIRFADGTIWNYTTVVSKVLTATGGDDSIFGSGNPDVIDGRAGNDYLEGRGGADRYLFGRGSGQDRIYDDSGNFGQNQVDIIEMAADVLPGDVTVSRVPGTADLLIKINGTSDRVIVQSHFFSVYTKLEEIRFSDGTVWNYQTLLEMSLAGTAGDDTLSGTADVNTINGGAGNDYMAGGVGSDVYVFGRGSGVDRLFDDSQSLGGASIDAVQLGADILPQDIILRQTGAFDLTLFIAGTADRLTIEDFFGSTGYRIEELRFANGTVWDLAAIYLNATTGTAGEDTIIGAGGADVVDAGAGSDYVNGGDGADTYKFGRGYGQDWLFEYDLYGYTDVVVMAADVAPADVLVSRSGNNLVLRIAGTPDRLTIESYYFVSGNYGINEVRFNDGTVWNRAALTAMAAATTSGDSSIIGNSSANTLDGGTDNDYLEGQGGADTYVFGRDYGQDRIYDNDANTANIDVISFLAGVSPSDVLVSRAGTNGGDLVLRIAETSDKLTVTEYFASTARRIEEIRFSDGTVWTYATVVAKAATGGSGDESVYGTDGVETLTGGGGNDYIEGRKGNDIYAFNRGNGQDRILDDDTTSGNVDTIQMGADILPSDIFVTRGGSSNNDIVLVVFGTSDRLTIIDGALNSTRRVEQVQFANGTVWTHATLLAMSHAGTAADQSLYGSDDANSFDGGAGNDYLEGRLGSDTYAFGRGSGQDRINDTDATAGNVDAIVFAPDVAPGDLTLWRSGTNSNDLTIEINGTSDRLVISRQFESGTYQVEELRFADGTIWDINTIKAKNLIGTEWNNTINGFSGNDTLLGNAGNDSLYGNDGADTLSGGADDDLVDGGAGYDVAVFSGDSSSYTITVGATETTVSGADGLDIVRNVEVLRFADRDIYAPIAVDSMAATPFESMVSGWLTASDPDGNQAELTFSLKTGATKGAVTVNADGTYSYTPNAGTSGADSFTFQVTDSMGFTSTATVSVDVAPAGQVRGPTTPVNAVVTGAQYLPAIAVLPGDRYVVAWTDQSAPGDTLGVSARIFDRYGTPLGSTFRVNTYITNEQSAPLIGVLADGGFVISWSSWLQDGSDWGVYAQRFDASGVAVGSEFRVHSTTTNGQTRGGILGLADGSFIITWNEFGRDGNDWGIFAKHYAADGTQIGSEFQINTYTTSFQTRPMLTALADGGFMVIWQSNGQDGSLTGVYGQRYDANAARVGVEFRINTTTANEQRQAHIAALADGGFVVVWQSFNQDGSGWGIYGQRYNSSAATVGSEFRINTYVNSNQGETRIGALPDGGFVVTWESFGQDGSDLGVYAQRFDASGALVGSEIQVSTVTSGVQRYPDIGVLSDGSFVIAYQSPDGAAEGIYTNTFSTARNITGGSGNDVFVGSTAADRLAGAGGDDELAGAAGNDTLMGGIGADTLSGGDGNDALEGEAGEDLLDGGLGSDIYKFGRGSGLDRIDNTESDSATANDRVEFGANIAFDQLWLTQSGNDLLLNVIGGSDTIRIQNWYSSSAATVDAFRTTDGKELTEARVQALVSAMASFAPPTGSDPNMPPDTRQQLDSALAAAWQPTT